MQSEREVIVEKYTPYSELKIFHHTDRIDKFLKHERVAPIYLRIKPTNVCNQRCYYCAYANNNLFDDRVVDKRESIPWDIMQKTLQDIKEIGVKAVTFSGGGDPLCYSAINETLQMVEDLGIDCSMITNGQALNGEVVNYLKKAKWIRVSFDSAKKETYEGIRGVNTYDQVIENIEKFAGKKDKTCTLGINCVISHSNANEIYDICKLVQELGADNIKLSPISLKENQEDYHKKIIETVMAQIEEAKGNLEGEKFRIIDKYSNDWALNDSYQKQYSMCYVQNFFAVIAADSKVYRCHQRAYTKAGEIGDLFKKTFKEIWFDEATIDKMNNFDPRQECKFRCAFDERNMLLRDFINMDINHVNFI